MTRRERQRSKQSHKINEIANSTSIIGTPTCDLTNYYAALADTTATYNYLETEATEHCIDIWQTFGPNVKVANGNIISPNKQGILKMSKELSQEAHHSSIFNDLSTGLLISIGKLCDDDCIALFSKYNQVF